MRKFLSLAVICSLAFPAMAFGQDTAEFDMPESPKTRADDMKKEFPDKAPVEGEGYKTIGTEEADTTLVVPGEDGEDTIVQVHEENTIVVDEDAVAEKHKELHPFLDRVDWMVMASAFYRIGGYLNDGVVAGTYNSLGYPYTNYNGFGLNFAGGDFQYTGEKFAIRLDLRFGEGSFLLSPIAPIKQGYVSWMPSDKLQFDFGFFDTVFGGEVVDEWNNANYTRGALYFLRQPFNHMGIRTSIEMSEKAGFTILVTNGGVLGGTPIDNNETPTLGWQFAFGGDAVGFFFGGQHGAGGDNDNKNWENFFDWVLTANAGIFSLIANGDYQTIPSGGAGDGSLAFAYGHSLQLIFDATDKFSIGLRGEHLSGNEQYRDFFAGGDTGLATATLTFRYKPVEYLVLSLEGRGEWNTRDIYFSRTAMEDTATGELIPNKSHNYAAILGFTAFIGN